MPFQPTIIFAAGYPTATTGVLQGVQTNLPIVVTFQGTSTAPLGAVTVVNQEIAVTHEPFQLSNGTKVNATTTTAELTFDWVRFNALSDGAKRALLEAFAGGERLSLAVAVQGVTNDQTLPIELRILKTTDYLIDPGGTVFAQPAHSSATSAPNLVVPSGDAITNYAYSTPTGALGAGALTSNANGRITVTAAAPPANVSNQTLRIEATAVPTVNGAGAATTVTATGDLTMDLHLPTEVVVQLDRSGSMNAVTTGTTTKWDAAKAAANLFSQLYGDAIPSLSGPNSTVLDSKRIALGRFTWPGFPGSFSVTYTPAAGFDNASVRPSIPDAETAGGATPIGQALTDSNSKYSTAGTPAWRRRQIVLLTDGMHNSGSPDLAAPANGVLTLSADPAAGVIIHAISYALTGETATPTLDALSAAHGGLLLGSESDDFELDPEKLRDKFIDILGTIIPVNRNGSLDAPSATIMVEDGVDRVIFVAPGEGGLSVTPPAGTATPATGAAHGISWAAVDAPRAGSWSLSTAGMAILDLALMLRCSIEARGVGQSVTVRAHLDFHGQPVSGATIRVTVRRPGESAGEVITAFVRAGGLFTVLRNTSLTSVAPYSADQPGARAKAIPAATAAAGFDVHGNGDTQSLRRTLLDSAEKARGSALQKASDDLTLTEVAPGLYEAELSSAFTQEDGLYTFEFHAEGATPSGNSFARDQSRCSTLAPIPSPAHSLAALEQIAVTDNGATWTATVFPRTATDRALGPGLGTMLAFSWVDASVRKEFGPVMTVDNLDGSYSATVTLPRGHKFPALGLYAVGVRGADAAPPAIVSDKSEDANFVSITLDRIRIIDPKDYCLQGKGELSFDVVVAPGGSPSRAVRTRVPERGVLKLGADDFVEPGIKIYEGYVEPGALVSVTMGGTEFDWFLFFKRKEGLARYHRTLEPKLGIHKFAPGDESQDPESLSDWQVWYTVEVE